MQNLPFQRSTILGAAGQSDSSRSRHGVLHKTLGVGIVDGLRVGLHVRPDPETGVPAVIEIVVGIPLQVLRSLRLDGDAPGHDPGRPLWDTR
jgi:hypothetical protein